MIRIGCGGTEYVHPRLKITLTLHKALISFRMKTFTLPLVSADILAFPALLEWYAQYITCRRMHLLDSGSGESGR